MGVSSELELPVPQQEETREEKMGILSHNSLNPRDLFLSPLSTKDRIFLGVLVATLPHCDSFYLGTHPQVKQTHTYAYTREKLLYEPLLQFGLFS